MPILGYNAAVGFHHGKYVINQDPGVSCLVGRRRVAEIDEDCGDSLERLVHTGINPMITSKGVVTAHFEKLLDE